MYSDIELVIIYTLNIYSEKAKADSYPSDGIWTIKLKEMLCKLGIVNGCKVCTSGFPDTYDGEWLFDLVWYRQEGEGEHKRLTEIELAAEIEWNLNFDAIKDDFEKLLVSNAKHRLFVCYVWQDNQQKIKAYFKEAVEKYRQGHKGDRFLIAILDYNNHNFSFELIVKE